jgi:hypothetical protein
MPESQSVEVHQPRMSGRDIVALLLLVVLTVSLRLAYFSGYGLGDDRILRQNIGSIINNQGVMLTNSAYRFPWWLSTALTCRLFGFGETGMILPVFTVAILGAVTVFLLARRLWGTAGGVISGLLLMFYPLDVAWSTMLTTDVFFSLFSALTLMCLIKALACEEQDSKRRYWRLTAVALWLAAHSKLTGVFLVPAIALICALRWHRLDRTIVHFMLTAAFLAAFSATACYVMTGDPLFPLHVEMTSQGLTGPNAFKEHPLTSEVFWRYPRLLFLPDHLGDFVHSIYPALIVLFLLTSRFTGLRTSPEVFIWFSVLFLGMQLNIHRVEGGWVTDFRNIRYTHTFVYPIVLLLTGYMVGLRQRVPALCYALLALVIAFSGWQSVRTAWKTHVCFSDCRNACRFLATLPPGPVYSDFQIGTWWPVLDVKTPGWQMREVHRWDREKRRAEFAALTSGYLVTGGGREPYYGCWDCIPSAKDVDRAKWQLLREFPGPAEPTPWRLEPLRVWTIRSSGAAGVEPKKDT